MFLQYSKKISITFLLIISFYSCRTSFPKMVKLNAPLPATGLSVSQELKYMLQTDQADRKYVRPAIFFGKKKRRAMMERDRQRTKRVDHWYSMDSLKTDEDKFKAAIIFMHSPDRTYRRKAYNILCDLEENGTTEAGRKRGAYFKPFVKK